MSNAEMLNIPGMFMIGAADRNVGKTEFACSLIKKFSLQHNIIGVKVTTIEQADTGCPRGDDGCDVCTSLKGPYCITEETNSQPDKDTCRMLTAGASKVFWLRVLKKHLKEGASALLETIPINRDGAVSVCESNSLRQVVEPGLFFMLKSPAAPHSAVASSNAGNFKPSAKIVAQYADRLVLFDGKNFDIDTDSIGLINGRWANKMQATAIIMAGGESVRMGQDKSTLPVSGTVMIKHIFDQIQPHFDQVLISSNDTSKYSFLGVDVIPDRITGKGPLMGIASALRTSVNDMNFVIACDMPEVDISLVRRMVREGKGFDAVVPQTGPSLYEPLFAVYKKSVLHAMDQALNSGKHRIIDPLKDCRVNYINLAGTKQLVNLNTIIDYQKFAGKKDNDTIRKSL